ncbi:UvrD-helicase domain-containing protein [Flexibacterium corallicola]|uniref:UvrD-helicase domain-containing protein n=1 Tax=Flexibacterium corallicola TaxID=3037259 RepID=UPI00286F21EE|nr:UvrD-helicase domain-containing protein [Pseudovibrio sp. M1P-2-3]
MTTYQEAISILKNVYKGQFLIIDSMVHSTSIEFFNEASQILSSSHQTSSLVVSPDKELVCDHRKICYSLEEPLRHLFYKHARLLGYSPLTRYLDERKIPSYLLNDNSTTCFLTVTEACKVISEWRKNDVSAVAAPVSDCVLDNQSAAEFYRVCASLYTDYENLIDSHHLIDYADALRIFTKKLRSDQSVQNIILAEFSTVILDDAHHLGEVEIKFLRALSDSGVTVVLIGDGFSSHQNSAYRELLPSSDYLRIDGASHHSRVPYEDPTGEDKSSIHALRSSLEAFKGKLTLTLVPSQTDQASYMLEKLNSLSPSEHEDHVMCFDKDSYSELQILLDNSINLQPKDPSMSLWNSYASQAMYEVIRPFDEAVSPQASLNKSITEILCTAGSKISFIDRCFRASHKGNAWSQIVNHITHTLLPHIDYMEIFQTINTLCSQEGFLNVSQHGISKRKFKNKTILLGAENKSLSELRRILYREIGTTAQACEIVFFESSDALRTVVRDLYLLEQDNYDLRTA